MKWFKRRKKYDDDFDRKYGDLTGRKQAVKEELSLEQEDLSIDNGQQRRQFVENHCEKIVESTKRIEETKKEYQMVNSYLTDIQLIETLPDASHRKIVELAKKVIVFDKDRREFGNSMSKMSSGQFNCMKEAEDNIGETLKSLQDDENYCQRVKSDLNHLEGEKMALKYEKKDMNERIYLVRGISKIALAAFAVLLIMLMVIQFAAHRNVTAFVYALVGVAAIGGTVLFGIYSSAVHNIKVIELKMNRAIGLLNKVKLKYVNVQSRIEYMYQKFDIHSAYELNKMWATYLRVCKEQEVYHKASDKLIEAEDALVNELALYNIKDAEIWLNQAGALVNEAEMKDIKTNLTVRRNRLKSTIDYNSDVIEKSQKAIKELVIKNPEHADEIMEIVDKISINTNGM